MTGTIPEISTREARCQSSRAFRFQPFDKSILDLKLHHRWIGTAEKIQATSEPS